VTDEAIALLAPKIGQPAVAADPVQHAGRVQPRALAPDERQVILDALRSDRFTDTASAEA
jgi:hypothetical protein